MEVVVGVLMVLVRRGVGGYRRDVEDFEEELGVNDVNCMLWWVGSVLVCVGLGCHLRKWTHSNS